ncbi:peptidase domain-containing ABC transporter [Xanthomonas vesicatoria]|uniref:peptidase domain-containing ABC transporter n=1 Tax=Xanthomonas vesicatoria TaxID=56460 RepID=UPI001E384A63|nr:peptidase domain-containing ABC transporter [Xanthomonas vesicatoria]
MDISAMNDRNDVAHDSITAEKFSFGWSKKIVPVMQSQASECGLACIVMLLNFHGREISLARLRLTGLTSSRGSSFNDLIELASLNGMQTRPLSAQMEDLSGVRVPAIAHVSGNHFVIIERVARSYIAIVDPAKGRSKVSLDGFSKIFTGALLECFPGSTFQKKTSEKDESTFAFIKTLGIVSGLKRSLLWMLMLAIALELTVLLSPLFMQVVIDGVITTGDFRLLTIACAGYLGLITYQTIVSSFRNWALSVLGAELHLGWTANLFRRLIRLPEQYFYNRSVGDILSRFLGLKELQNLVSVSSIEVALDSIMLIGVVSMLFHYSNLMAWIAILGSIAYLIIRFLSLESIAAANIDFISADAKRESSLIEFIKSHSSIRFSNLQPFAVGKVINLAASVQRNSLKLQSIQLVYGAIGAAIIGLVKVITVYTGAKLIVSGHLSAGMLIAFIAYCDQFSGRSSKLVDFLVSLKVLKLYVNRLKDITSSEEEANFVGTPGISIDNYDLSFRQVSFRYGINDRPILVLTSFDIPFRSKVALVGPSGAGKSTLVKIIAGIISPQTGSVIIGGSEFREVGRKSVRDIISFVTQDDNLMSGTLMENISGFSANPDEGFAKACASIAGIHNDVMSFPMRYETVVGDSGVLLSSGQRQRVCLARALYREPKILVLDEATSHLDLAKESEVMASLGKLEITIIIIAHRPETVRYAEQVFALDGGKVLPLSSG